MIVLIILTVLFLALQAADVLSTIRFLKAGTGYEANPLAAWAMRRLGPWWPLIKVPEAGIAAAAWLLPAPVGIIVLGALCFVYGIVVWQNYRL